MSFRRSWYGSCPIVGRLGITGAGFAGKEFDDAENFSFPRMI
jgi:hypothetical protein